MTAYIIRRFVLIVPTLFIVSLIAFFTIRLIPGDVVDLMAAMLEQYTSGVEDTRGAIRREL